MVAVHKMQIDIHISVWLILSSIDKMSDPFCAKPKPDLSIYFSGPRQCYRYLKYSKINYV